MAPRRGTLAGELQVAAARFWGLSWRIKGPVIAAVILIILLAVTPGGGEEGGDGEPLAGSTPSPAPAAATPTATPSPAPTPTPTPAPAATAIAAPTATATTATATAAATAAPTATATAASTATATATAVPTATATATAAPTATATAIAAPTATATAIAAPTATATAIAVPTATATVVADAELLGLVEELRGLVAEVDPGTPEYDRDEFASWLDDDDEDCLNTRHEVLVMEAITFTLEPEEGCFVEYGEWYDPFTDQTFTDPRDLDVDHVVALVDAWNSGAWAWTDERRDAFANDLDNLNAIEAFENRVVKSGRGPAEYTPSNPAQRCSYLAQYAEVKVRWTLTITPQDFQAVSEGLSRCSSAADATPTPH